MQTNGTLYGAPSDVIAGDERPVLELRDIVKSFGRNRALDGVSLSFLPGTVHGLVGANGAGKSTFIKVVGGVHAPDAGSVRRGRGEPLRLSSPREAEAAGVAVVHQETQVFPDLTVAQNLSASRVPARRIAGVPVRSRRKAEVVAADVLARLGADIPLDARVGDLELAEKKLIQIGRALVGDPQLVLLDEPTAALEAAQSARIVELLRTLAADGLAVVFVSHKLDEVIACSDHVSVLASGRLIDSIGSGSPHFTASRLSELVAGRRLEPVTEPRVATSGSGVEPLVVWRRDDGPTAATDELAVRPGEIVTLAGLLGSGAAKVARDIAGAEPNSRARVRVGGTDVSRSRVRASRRGVGFVPQERKRDGVLPELSVEQNIALSSLGQVSRAGVLRRGAVRRQARQLIDQLDIRPADPAAKAGTLSGGNQQKVLLARWLAAGARVLVVEEPTHGIDVGAKQHVSAALRSFSDDGGVVVVSALESDEFIEISDRFVVFRGQRMVLDSSAPVDLEQIWSAALGLATTPSPTSAQPHPTAPGATA